MENMKKETKTLNRREFLGLTWIASIFALFGQAGTALYQFIKPRIKPGAFGGKVIAGQVAEFPKGSVSHVQEGRFYLSHLEDGTLLAMWHRCTHLGCTVPWRADEGVFHCPCHSSIFNTKGEVLSGPAPRPLDVFTLEIVEGKVVVDTREALTREGYDPSQGLKI